jgi:hypothetical protein
LLQGLAFQGLSKQANVVPPFFNMLQQKLLDAPEFSIWLNKNITQGIFPAGQLLFGGINSSLYTGGLQYHSVISTRYFLYVCTPQPLHVIAFLPSSLVFNHFGDLCLKFFKLSEAVFS